MVGFQGSRNWTGNNMPSTNTQNQVLLSEGNFICALCVPCRQTWSTKVFLWTGGEDGTHTEHQIESIQSPSKFAHIAVWNAHTVSRSPIILHCHRTALHIYMHPPCTITTWLQKAEIWTILFFCTNGRCSTHRHINTCNGFMCSNYCSGPVFGAFILCVSECKDNLYVFAAVEINAILCSKRAVLFVVVL